MVLFGVQQQNAHYAHGIHPAPPSPSLLQSADLTLPIPETIRKLSQQVQVREQRVQVEHLDVFFREALPPGAHYAKATVLFLHGQSFSSACWANHLAVFAALGYRCIAPDLPGAGQSLGYCAEPDRPQFTLNLIRCLDLQKVLVVAASMSAQYILPLLAKDVFIGAVGVALSNTHQLSSPSTIRVPVLAVWGDRDTSLGPSAANNLRHLPNCRLEKIPSAGHSAHTNNETYFQAVAFNFFELVRNYKQL